MRESISFQVSEAALFKAQLLNWCAGFSKCSVLDSNGFDGTDNELIAAVGSVNEICPKGNSFEELRRFHDEKKDWLFGYMSYDLKNEIEALNSEHSDGIGFPQMHFFQPEYVFIQKRNKLIIEFLPHLSSAEKAESIYREIMGSPLPSVASSLSSVINNRISKTEYINTVNKIKQHIRLGDIYEMNYCQEFFSEDAQIEPMEVFLKLSEASQAPFSAFYRVEKQYLMCASPERFLKKSGSKIISQPIKGTARRGKNEEEDMAIKKALSQNEKEKSENVMIVDLVRNDLSRSCDNVKTDELFGVYTFKQWHQMISTVNATLREGVHFTEVMKNSFPMGSMTGAPKVRAMELIEQYEKTKRGLYSGAVGYITPEGDFDFNVVIRSILYNKNARFLSFQVGSAITANSIPENEYEECLLKAKGMFEALEGNGELKSQFRNQLSHA